MKSLTRPTYTQQVQDTQTAQTAQQKEQKLGINLVIKTHYFLLHEGYEEMKPVFLRAKFILGFAPLGWSYSVNPLINGTTYATSNATIYDLEEYCERNSHYALTKGFLAALPNYRYLQRFVYLENEGFRVEVMDIETGQTALGNCITEAIEKMLVNHHGVNPSEVNPSITSPVYKDFLAVWGRLFDSFVNYSNRINLQN